MLKKTIIAALAVSLLGTGMVFAESSHEDDDDYGYEDCAVMDGQAEDHDGDHDYSCDGEDDDDDGNSAMVAPAGSVPPPDNGLITSGSTPSVSVQ